MTYVSGKLAIGSTLHLIKHIGGGGMSVHAICGAPECSDPSDRWLTGDSLTGEERRCPACAAEILKRLRSGEAFRADGWLDAIAEVTEQSEWVGTV